MKRACGQCTLCCKLVPVAELQKPANTRCAHQRMGQGCMIYAKRPLSCRGWSCRWFSGEDTADQRRPDLSHCVIDTMPDFVTLDDGETGQKKDVPVIQIWVDPRHRRAWEAKEIMAYIERRANEGWATIVRYDHAEATVVFAPVLTLKLFGRNHWFRRDASMMTMTSHTQSEVINTISRLSGDDGMKRAERIFQNLFTD